MTENMILQLLSIMCRMALMAFLATRFVNMKYGFYRVFVRYVFYKDEKPLEWLKENLLYLYLLIFECSQFYLITGMLHQFAINQVETITWEFFFASPLASISIILILRECFLKEKTSQFGNKLPQNSK